MLAEMVVPELAHAVDLANEARAAKLPAPFDAWCAALLSPDPGARPRPSWLASQAEFTLAEGGHPLEDEVREESRDAIRASYLGSRRAELSLATRARSARVAVAGEPGTWLGHALDLARRAALLEGCDTSGEDIVLDDADPLARTRWLVALVGVAAARWSLTELATERDEVWAARLGSLAARRDPRAWTLADLQAHSCGGPQSGDLGACCSDICQRSRGRAFSLGRAQTARGRGHRTRDCEVSGAAARGRRGTTQVGRSGASARPSRERRDPAVQSLRADVARRAGERALAESDARAVLARDPGDDRALGVLARLLVDAGDARGALDLLAGAPRSSHTEEARVLALMACGDRALAERAIGVAESLASTEEARGRVAGLVGYVAHQSGDTSRASAAFARAADHAERAEAVVEEATYLTGHAAAAVDEGDLAAALAASSRAALLWEHLARPREAARALLARAAAFSAAGAHIEAAWAGREARERARLLGDLRAEAFACWALTDAQGAGHPGAIEPARFALRALSSVGTEEDILRALARVLRHAPSEVGRRACPVG